MERGARLGSSGVDGAESLLGGIVTGLVATITSEGKWRELTRPSRGADYAG